jgi:hypothetical protein
LLRVVLPLEPAALAVLGFILFLHAWAALAKIFGNDYQDAYETASVVILAAAMVYAGFRAVYFNPIENRRYGAWLAYSAWDSSKPMPLGPMELAWQDVAIVVLLTLLFPPVVLSRAAVPTAFLLVYCVGSAYSQARSGIYWSSYGVSFLAGCFIIAIFSPWARLAIAAAMYGACWLERRWLLGRFPFEGERGEPLLSSWRMDERSTTLGWPMPPVEDLGWRWIRHRDAALVGAMTAWLIFCATYHFRELPEFDEGIRRVLYYVVAITVVARLWIYLFGYPPPISLFGRIATGRFIIPKYDVVFVAPLAAAVIALLFNDLATRAEIAPLVATPIACGVVTWLALALPPRRIEWIYTGGHRVAYQFRAKGLDRSKSASGAIERERAG